jgi:hypothetical protein
VVAAAAAASGDADTAARMAPPSLLHKTIFNPKGALDNRVVRMLKQKKNDFVFNDTGRYSSAHDAARPPRLDIRCSLCSLYSLCRLCSLT